MDALNTSLQRLLDILRDSCAQGITELELMQRLLGEPNNRGDNLELFRRHFVLRHLLYRLRDQLWQRGEGHLEIGPIRLRLHPYSPGAGQLDQADPLRDYYLDMDNLRNTDGEEVERLLHSFWQRLAAADDKHQALAELQLQEPVDLASITRRYRQLCQQHHPDKGGDGARFQRINQAMAVLRRYYAV